MKNLKIEKQKINESFQHNEKYAYGEVRSFKEFKELKNNIPDYFLVDLKNKKIVAGYAAYNVPNYGIYTGNKNKSGYEIWNRSTMKNPEPYLNQFPLDYEDKNNWLVVDPRLNEGENYSNKFAAWFTGTVLNSVKHPEYGKNQLTPEQIKMSPDDYKNKLYKAIKKAFDAGDLDEEIYTQHESKMSLEDYLARVKKLVDKTTFDDQDFYDHMIDCFIEGKTPEVCAKFNESQINEQEAYTKADLEKYFDDWLAWWYWDEDVNGFTFSVFVPAIKTEVYLLLRHVDLKEGIKETTFVIELPNESGTVLRGVPNILSFFKNNGLKKLGKLKSTKDLDSLLDKFGFDMYESESSSLNESESTWTKLKAITEAKRIQVKRKYTEIHPAKYVGERARVRNEIIKYLGSNQLMTEDEFEDLLSKNAKHPLLWKKRNRDVYEQGEDGYIRLSKKGYRIFGGLNSVNEAEYIDALNAIETDGFVDAFIVNKIDIKDTDFQYLRKKYVKTYEAITKYLKSKYPTEFMEIEEDFDAVITDFKNFEEFKSLMNDKEFQKLRARYLEIRNNLYDYTESKVNESNLAVDLIDVWTIKDKSKLASVLKYLQANNVEFEYNPKNSSVEIIDVSNLTPKGLEELQKMLK